MQLANRYSIDVFSWWTNNGDGIVDGWWYKDVGYGQSGTIEVRDMKNYRWGTQDSVYVK